MLSRFPTFCSANRAPRLSDNACFEIVDVILETIRFLENICHWQRNCPGQVASSKKIGFLGKSSAPGSAAAPDKWLGREKATDRCSQGRGAPFGGSGGLRPPESRGVPGGGAAPPPDCEPNLQLNSRGRRHVASAYDISDIFLRARDPKL